MINNKKNEKAITIVIAIEEANYKIGTHGFVYRQRGDEWINASISRDEFAEMVRAEEIRIYKAEIARKKDVERVTKRDAEKRQALIEQRMSA